MIHSTNPDPVMQLLRRGLHIGNRAVIETVESEGVRVDLPEGGRWYDVRPMLDPREHSPQVIDMAVEAISYGEAMGLLHRHASQRYLVRILAAE